MTNIKELFKPKDMTRGTPWKRIALFAIPMLLGNIAQQLYNTVDSIIVGQYVGDSALAAVGSAGPILNLLMVLFISIATGAGIMVSQYFGARAREELSHTIGVCITLTALASVFLMLFGTWIARPFLQLLQTPDSLIDASAAYLQIFMLGGIGFAYYNILAGVLRGLGDSISPLLYLLFATLSNILLDLLFVVRFGMGVPGVALATVLAQGMSAFFCFRRLLQMNDTFDLKRRHLKLEGFYVKKLLRLGIPSGLTQGIFSMAMVLVQSLTNSFGPAVIAANVMVMRVDGFAIMPNFTFGHSMTTYTGQNIGAGKLERIDRGIRDGLKMALLVSAILTGLILLFGKFLMGLFSNTPELVDFSYKMMTIIAPGYLAMAVTQTLSGVMRGAGDTLTPMWVALITTVVVRVPTAYGIAYLTRSAQYPTGRPEAVFASLLVAWFVGALITSWVFRKRRWMRAV